MIQLHVAVDGFERSSLAKVAKIEGITIAELCRRGVNLWLESKDVRYRIGSVSSSFRLKTGRERGRPSKVRRA